MGRGALAIACDQVLEEILKPYTHRREFYLLSRDRRAGFRDTIQMLQERRAEILCELHDRGVTFP